MRERSYEPLNQWDARDKFFQDEAPDIQGGIQESIINYAPGVFYQREEAREEIVKQAHSLAAKYELDAKFALNGEANLYLLAVAAAWEESTLNERKSLVDVLKLAAVDRVTDGGLTSLSNKVVQRSGEGSPRWQEFDPKSTLETETRIVSQKLQDFKNEHIDRAMTERAKEALRWDRSSPLAHTRSVLLIREDSELPFSIHVLNKTPQEISNAVGWSAWHTTFANGEREIVLGSVDGRISSELDHEYAHTQQKDHGLSFGYNGLLMRGLNEAFTEYFTANPLSYPRQRAVLYKLYEKVGSLYSIQWDAYKGEKRGKKEFLKQLIDGVGLKGFLMLARMDASDSSRFSGLPGDSIYIPAEQVYEYLDSLK